MLGVIGFFVPGNAGSAPAGPLWTQYSVLIFSVSRFLNALHTLIGVLGHHGRAPDSSAEARRCDRFVSEMFFPALARRL